LTCISRIRCGPARSLSPRVKTDAVDAKTLAHLLRTGTCPRRSSPRPSCAICAICASCCATARRRPGLRPSLKNRVHALLARHGIAVEHSDLFGKGGLEFLASLELADGPHRRLESVLALICDFDREITATTQEIDARAKADERVAVLGQIRGIGRYTTMLIIAEVGDVGRFPTARHLCAWAGLTPTVRSPEGKARPGAHLPPRLHRAALGADRGCAEAPHRRRPPTRPVRADRQTPRTQGRQSRDRPPDPHPLLLRAARRRDPLPPKPRPRNRQRRRPGARRMTTSSLTFRTFAPRRKMDARASSPFSLTSG
jgi:transposase